MTRADLAKLEVPLNDPIAAQLARHLQTLIDTYDAGIRELQKPGAS